MTKQTVYLPVNEFNSSERAICTIGIPDLYGDKVIEQEAFVFTPEQLNEYTQSVIKQTLEAAAEKAKINYKEDGEVTKVKSKKLDIDYLSEVSSKVSFNINKESITNTFEETYNKLKV